MGLWEKAQHRFETAFGSEQARAFARFTRADLIRRIRVGFSGSYIPNKNRPFKYSATAHCGAGSCIRIEIPISFKNASSWLATSRDLELRKCAQRRNVGIAPPAVAHICSNDANTDFFCRHDVFSLSGLSTLRWTRSLKQRSGNFRVRRPHGQDDRAAASRSFDTSA